VLPFFVRLVLTPVPFPQPLLIYALSQLRSHCFTPPLDLFRRSFNHLFPLFSQTHPFFVPCRMSPFRTSIVYGFLLPPGMKFAPSPKTHQPALLRSTLYTPLTQPCPPGLCKPDMHPPGWLLFPFRWAPALLLCDPVSQP